MNDVVNTICSFIILYAPSFMDIQTCISIVPSLTLIFLLFNQREYQGQQIPIWAPDIDVNIIDRSVSYN